jgi:hypothetical protein
MDSTFSPREGPEFIFEDVRNYFLPIEEVLDDHTNIFKRIVDQNISNALKDINYEGH